MAESGVLLNSPEALAPLVAQGKLPARRVWGMLALRSAVTFGLLLALAAVFAAVGRQGAISASAAWWLWFVTAANVVCIVLMARFGRAEGVRLRDIYFASRSTWKGDLLWVLIGFAGTAILAQAPGIWLAGLLWGNPNTPNPMLFQALPIWAIYPLFLVFPISHGFAELPIYWGYVAPRLRVLGTNRWVVILIVGLVLSLQHMFFSFQLDWRYDLWLAIKFIPFALWTGFIIDRRPTALPYMMVGHMLLDSLLPYLLLLTATGVSLG
jgi:hypothetical protein